MRRLQRLRHLSLQSDQRTISSCTHFSISFSGKLIYNTEEVIAHRVTSAPPPHCSIRLGITAPVHIADEHGGISFKHVCAAAMGQERNPDIDLRTGTCREPVK